MKKHLKYMLSGAIIAIAVIMVLLKYRDYITNPWTRDGQVQAEVIQLTPRVSGPIVNLPITDNQFVKAGDLLFEIDPRTFKVSLDQARAQLDETGDDVKALEKQVEMAKAGVAAAQAATHQAKSKIDQLTAIIAKNKANYGREITLLPQGATSQRDVDFAKANYEVSVQEKIGAYAGLQQAKAAMAESQASLAETEAQLGAIGESNPQVRAALAAVRQAELNLQFTKVHAPVDGYITNLELRKGSQAIANQPALALVDVNSYWIVGYFKENTIANIHSGDRAIVTLMTYQSTPLEGLVESIGWGIAQQDGSTGFDLLPNINPTFEWIRLAQRVPVKIHLNNVPKHIKLRVGTTCSVLVMTGTSDSSGGAPVPVVPSLLQ
jgi:multidrug resistance efflux pump